MAQPGANGLFLAGGYGSAMFVVTQIAYGAETVFQEGESATERTVYFRNVVDDNFVVTMEFDSWAAKTAAANWFQTYMRAVADPDTNTVSPMFVSVPSRNFFKVGIPQTGVSFGEEVAQIVYPMTVVFVGTADYSSAGSYGKYSTGTLVTKTKITEDLDPAVRGNNLKAILLAYEYTKTGSATLTVESQLYDTVGQWLPGGATTPTQKVPN